MKEGINQYSPLPKYAKPSINTRDELAKIAGVSHGTYSKGKKKLDSENEKIKEKVLKGESHYLNLG